MHNSIKDKILSAIDIVEVVGEHVSLARRGKDYIGLCPFHPDHKPSLAVSPTKQIFKCFACGAGGDVIKFVQLRERVDFRTALASLAERAGIDLRAGEADRHADDLRQRLRPVLAWAQAHFQRNLNETPDGRAAREYARRRGFSDETIARHGLGYAANAWDDLLRAARRAGLGGDVLEQAGLVATSENRKPYDRFRHRLMFPICDALGRCVAFGGRTLGDDPAKYLNSPETSLFSKSRVLYALHLARARIEETRTAIVVEGYTDAVLLHQYGFRNVVATLGTALTDAHVKRLRPLTDRVILCFDGDAAGRRAADRAVEVSLGGRLEVRVAVLEAGRDPADCLLAEGAAGFERVLASAVDALEFKWSQTMRAFADGGPGSRRAAIEALLDFVARTTAAGGIDPLEQGLLVRRLAELMGLPPEAVHDMLAAARRRPRARTAADEAAAAEAESDYAAAIRGLPSGLVAAAEDCFGLLLMEAACAAHIEEAFAQAVESVASWRRLYAIIQELRTQRGTYARADVIERCTDADVCELVGRACARVAGTVDAREAFRSAQARLSSELEALRMGELRHALCRETAATSGDEVFGDLLRVARKQEFALPAEKRWSARPAS